MLTFRPASRVGIVVPTLKSAPILHHSAFSQQMKNFSSLPPTVLPDLPLKQGFLSDKTGKRPAKTAKNQQIRQRSLASPWTKLPAKDEDRNDSPLRLPADDSHLLPLQSLVNPLAAEQF